MRIESARERRSRLLIRLAAVATAAAAFSAACSIRFDDAKRPNVLLLVMDTTRADRCSVMGYGRPTTPRLDDFAKDAVVFTKTWSPANWTGPAHASLFTGVGPDVHGFQEGRRPRLDAGRTTVAERFAAAGYATGCFTNNEIVSPEFGLSRGFQTFVPLFEDASRPEPRARSTHDAAAAWAEAAHASGRPFFLFVNDMEPHQPYDPPEDDARLLVRGPASAAEIARARAFAGRDSLAHVLGVARSDQRGTALLSDLYDAEIRSLDREVGGLLDRLRRDGLLDSTVVAIVSDHGEMLGERGLLDHGSGLHRAVLHVPFVLRFPGRFDGGRVVEDVVRLEDVAPTLLGLCELPALDGAEGISLTEGTAGRIARARQPPDNWVSLRALRDFPSADASTLRRRIDSVFDGRFHLLSYADGAVELYDTAIDPDERDDVSAREPREAERLVRLIGSGR